jgi:predicted Fe-S protein YdhL (DUF1289 family)
MSSPRAGAAAPMSPCINVCVLGADGLCNGCLRDRYEIGGWSAMSAAEQWSVIARLDARRSERGTRRTPSPPPRGP